MTRINITSGSFEFSAVLEEEKSPASCAWFLDQLPLKLNMVQAAWSGMAVFADLNDSGKAIPFENPTSYPTLGQVLMYPGNKQGNCGEIYIPYGGNRFACPIGKIAGNPLLTIIDNVDQLAVFGRHIRYHGAQQVLFRAARVGPPGQSPG